MKGSQLFMIILAAVALIGYFEGTQDGDASVLFTRFLALSAYFLLCLSMLSGPAAVLMPAKFAPLIESRRAIGVGSFLFVLAHMLLVADKYFGWDLGKMIGVDAIIPGMVGFWILLALALTSTDWATKTLGQNVWKNLQRFVYLAFIVSTVHFVKEAAAQGSAKLNAVEIALYALGAATVILQLVGFYVRRQREAAAKKAQAAAPAAKSASPAAP